MLLTELRRECAHALRALARSPGFTVVASATLALGVGAATAIFTVLDTVLLKPLPYSEPDRLVTVLHPATVPGSGERLWGVSPGGYFAIAEQNRTLEQLALYRTASITVTNEDQAEVTSTALVTAGLFSVLESTPHLGRLLDASDDRPGAPQVAVIGYGLFVRRFGADSSVIGRTLETNEGTFEIVGVASPALTLPMPDPFAGATGHTGLAADVWLPLGLDRAGPFYNEHPYVGLARMRPGITVADVQADLDGILARFAELVPSAYSDGFIRDYAFRIQAQALQETVVGPRLPRTLWMLFGAVLLVLAIAAANVANLYLVRFDARAREAAVRTALGASTSQMAIHHVAETLMLCGAAAIVGIGLAAAALPLLVQLAPSDVPRLASLSLDARAVLVALGIALVLGLVLGGVPMLRQRAPAEVLRSGHRGLASSPRQRLLRGALVVGQCAMALTLLAAAGLMLRSFAALRDVDPGFNVDGVLAVDLTLPYAEFSTRPASIAFHRQVSERLATLPGVTQVGSMTAAPLDGFGSTCVAVYREGRPYRAGETLPCVPSLSVTPGAFEALQVPIAGTPIRWEDIDGNRPVAIVTEALAERLWPGEDPMGKGIRAYSPDSDLWYRVAGVVRDVRGDALQAEPSEAVFYSAGGVGDDQHRPVTKMTYLIRTSGDPLTLVPAVRASLRAMNPRVPVSNPRAMRDVLDGSMAHTTFLLVLLAIAAGMALLLSAVGLYGVIASIVNYRRPELGIRLALGATEGGVLRLVLRQSARLVGIGIAAGVVGAFAVSRVLQAVLFGVVPNDPLVLIGAAGVLAVTGAVASLVPAYRASQLPPRLAMQGD